MKMFSFRKVLLSLILINGSLGLEYGASPIPHTDCPLIDDVNHAVMLPYPQDCSKYYSCSNGNAYLQQCPNNLHWSPLTYRCDYPEIAKCEVGILNSPPTTAAIVPPYLTASPTGEIIYQLLLNDCSKYYKCQAMICPTNYHWNALTQACDFPHNAHCPFMMGISTAVAGLTVNSNLQQPSTLPFTTNSSEMFAQVYPNDCSKYYQCQSMLCPANYHWNYRSQQCDLPQLAQCPWQTQLLSVTPTNTVAVPTAFTAPPTPATMGPPIVVTENPLLDCPECQHLCDGYLHQYLPHPHDCHKFIQCNGWSYIHTCPDNLFWNAVLNTCDRVCVTN